MLRKLKINQSKIFDNDTMSHKFPTKFGHYEKSVKLVIVAISGREREREKKKRTNTVSLPAEQVCQKNIALSRFD